MTYALQNATYYVGETEWVVAVCMVGDPRRGMIKEGLGMHSR